MDKKKSEIDSKMSKIRKSIDTDKKSLGNTREALQRTKALDSLKKSRDKGRESCNLKTNFLSPSRNIVSLDDSSSFYKDLDRPEEGNESFNNPININVGPLYQRQHYNINVVPQECSRRFKEFLDSNYCFFDNVKNMYLCDLCDVKVTGKASINQHIKGRRHQDAVFEAEEEFDDILDEHYHDVNPRYNNNANKNIDLRSKLKNRN